MAQNEVPNAPSLRDRVSEIFQVPRPIKALFDAVPVITYPANELPERSPEASELPCLYIFSTEEDAEAGKPSFNPGCLKYQASGLALEFTLAQNNYQGCSIRTSKERLLTPFPHRQRSA